MILLISWYVLPAQITFDRHVFPSEGDSLVYLKDIANSGLNMNGGENQIWDLRRLESPLFSTTNFKRSAFYAKLDQTDHVFFDRGNNNSTLLMNSDRGLEEIGFLWQGPNAAHVIPVYYDKSIIINPNSLSYGERSYNRVHFSYDLDRTVLPVDIQADLPFSVKQITIEGTKTINRTSDAWGKLILPLEKLMANRIRVTEYTTIKLFDSKTKKAITYFDEKMIRKIFPYPLSANFYEFYTKEHKSYTARIKINEKGQMISIDYQSEIPEIKAVNLDSRFSDFILFPNPTYNIAKVYVSKHKTGKYSLAIYNIIGKKLWQRGIDVEGQTIIKENFGFLPKGTYFISLLDENGNILRTTRLIIISV